MLVDDAVNDIALMRIACRKAGFTNPLQILKDGAETIACLKGDPPYDNRQQHPLPTILLLDLNMPRKNGFEVLAWLRQQPVLKRLPVIILTASSRVEDIERAYDLGANGFFVKPSNLDKLMQMIQCLKDWIDFNQFAPLGDPMHGPHH